MNKTTTLLILILSIYTFTFSNNSYSFIEEIVVPQTYPVNGTSPYNSYFGSGIYDDTQNSIIVNSPKNSDIVFLLKNAFSGKTIRNEFIRKNSTFELTEIPYGTYIFVYFSGTDWSYNESMKNGRIRGGFTKNKSFSKSEYSKDRMEFKTGYYGSYELTLTQVISGNLETQPADEDDFF
jgi:hypothetical protein|tara:strand:+ start:590 stop:1126 length:537 start_codon:yes stop_codon:yes gene_type:complete